MSDAARVRRGSMSESLLHYHSLMLDETQYVEIIHTHKVEESGHTHTISELSTAYVKGDIEA